MNYKEIIPASADLHPYIYCFWSATIGTAPSTSSLEILPNLFANIFITLSGNFVLSLGKQQVDCHPGHIMLAGARTRLLSIVASEPSQILGIKFNPAGLYPFLNIPLENLADKIVTSVTDSFLLESLLPVLKQPDMQERLSYLDDLFLKQSKLCQPIHEITETAVSKMVSSNGQARIEDIATGMDVSKRSLERYFLKHVGLSPKSVCRIIRLRKAVEKILYGTEVNLAEVAFNLGFYDQAHLFNEIKEVLGKSPSTIAQEVEAKSKIFVSGRL